MLFYKSRLNALLELLRDKAVRREIQKTLSSDVDAILTPDKLLQLLKEDFVRGEIREVALSAIDANPDCGVPLQLLQNEAVRREIRKIALSAIDANSNPDKFLQTLENETIRQKIQNIALEGSGLKTPIDANSSPSYEQVSDLNQEICAAQEAYKAYSSLPQSLRDELRNVINCTNVMTFAVSGCIDHNLEVLWDCCRRSIIDGKLSAENIDCLISVFRYYFELLNASVRDGEYAYLAVKPGDEYEEDFAQGMPGNPAQGMIGQVLLQGFRYTRGKVVRRSLVEIRKEAR